MTAPTITYGVAPANGTFTFPSATRIRLEANNVYADLPIPSRLGNISQFMGMNSPEIVLEGKIDVSTTGWGTPLGEYLMLAFQGASVNAYEDFTSDVINCRVTPRNMVIEQDGTALRTWRLTLKMQCDDSQTYSALDLAFWGF